MRKSLLYNEEGRRAQPANEERKEPTKEERLQLAITVALQNTGYQYYDYSCTLESRSYDYTILNGVPIVTGVVTEDDGLSTRMYVEIVPIIRGKQFDTIEVTTQQLKHLMDCLPPNAICGNAKALENCVRKQCKDETRWVTKYSHTGIREIDGEYVYIFSGGAITKDGISNTIRCCLDDNLKLYSFTDADSLEKWDTFRKFLEVAPHTVMYPLLSLVALCPLHEALRESGNVPEFTMALLGRSGTRKSTLAALTLNFFGQGFSGTCLPCSANDTVNSLEIPAFTLKDSLCVIDDFYPTTTPEEADGQKKMVQRVARLWGNKNGTARAVYDKGLKQDKKYFARGLAMLTGERLPPTFESGESRFLRLELRSGDVDIDVLTEVQENTTHLNQCMRGYIQWLLDGYADRGKDLKERLIDLRLNTLSMFPDGHGRTAEAVAHLQLAMEQWTNYLCESGVINSAERNTMLSENWSILVNMADSQNQTINENKPENMFLDTLRELLTKRTVMIKPRKSDEKDYRGERFIGWEDDHKYYLLPDATYAQINQAYWKRRQTFPLEQKALYHYLMEQGIIEAGTKNKGKLKPQRAVNINGKTEWLIVLPKCKLAVESADEDSTM